MKKYIILLSIFLSIILSACDDAPEVPVDEPNVEEPAVEEPEAPETPETPEQPSFTEMFTNPISLTSDEKTVVTRTNDFAWNLLAQVNEDKSLSISPLSISLALSMLANGMSNEAVLAETLEALGFGDLDIAAVNSCNKKLAYDLTNVDSTVKVAIANGMWTNPSKKIKEDFAKAMADYYQMEFYTINFPTLAADVNQWCAEKTFGLIKEVLRQEDLNPDIFMILANALYFKAGWQAPGFNPELTKKEPFHYFDGSSSEVDMMNATDYYSCAKADGLQMLSIPFAQDMFAFDVILPDEGVSIEDAIASLRGNGWKNLKTAGKSTYASIYIPKMDISFNKPINDELQALGINGIFNSWRNFGLITNEDLKVDQVTHITKFKVDEEGAEAAAVTIIDIPTSAEPDMEIPQPIVFRADRPFIFTISERSTGVLLFVGKVTKF